MAIDYNDKGYDYKLYWASRSYEHNAEVLALKKLLPRSGKSIIDIGGGFGRLLPIYKDRFENITILDASKKHLNQARQRAKSLGVSNISFQIGILPIRDTPESGVSRFDCALMVRVSHHLNDFDSAVKNIYELLESNGVFIFEFANKMHFLNILKNVVRLNFKFFSKDSYKAGTFTLWHPKMVSDMLKENGFEIQEKLSVSNFRNPQVKKIVPEAILLVLEDILQKPLSYFNFGPSIFFGAIKNSKSENYNLC